MWHVETLKKADVLYRRQALLVLGHKYPLPHSATVLEVPLIHVFWEQPHPRARVVHSNASRQVTHGSYPSGEQTLVSCRRYPRDKREAFLPCWLLNDTPQCSFGILKYQEKPNPDFCKKHLNRASGRTPGIRAPVAKPDHMTWIYRTHVVKGSRLSLDFHGCSVRCVSPNAVNTLNTLTIKYWQGTINTHLNVCPTTDGRSEYNFRMPASPLTPTSRVTGEKTKSQAGDMPALFDPG